MKKLWNRKPAGNFFPLPNALFRLNLLPGEIAVYAYLMYRENRQTYLGAENQILHPNGCPARFSAESP